MLGEKVAQFFPKIAQKGATTDFTSNGMVIKRAPKVTKYLGYFYNKISHREL